MKFFPSGMEISEETRRVMYAEIRNLLSTKSKEEVEEIFATFCNAAIPNVKWSMDNPEE